MSNKIEQFVCDICGKVLLSKRSFGNHRSWCEGKRKKPVRKPQTEEAKRNISKAHKGRKLSKEHVDAIKRAHPKQPRETRVCAKLDCNNAFVVLPSSKKKYCSPYCSRHDLKVPREKRYCKFCGKEFTCRATDGRTCCNLDHQLAYRRTLIDHQNPERNKKISDTVSLQYISGTRECRNGYDEGWIVLETLGKEVYCRSSYEKDFLRNIDIEGLLKDVKSEPIRIPYKDIEGVNRYYIPDFLISLKDSSEYLVEVKPEYQLEEGNNKFKFKVGFQYSEENNLTFLIATETSIYSTNNGSTTGFLQEIEEATAAILHRMMIQSEPSGNRGRLDESTNPPTV